MTQAKETIKVTIWQRHAGSIIAAVLASLIPTIFVLMTYYANQAKNDDLLKRLSENQSKVVAWKEVHTQSEILHAMCNSVDLKNLSTEIRLLGGREVEITTIAPREPVQPTSRQAQ
jgi:hypothetical protein